MKRYIDNLYFGNHSWKNDWAELEIIIFLYFFDQPHQVLPFLYRSRWKAEIFTVNVNWVNNLIICPSVIRVGKMTEQSWNIFNFLHFLLPSTHSLTISNSRWKIMNYVKILNLFNDLSIKAPVCQWVSLCVCLDVP